MPDVYFDGGVIEYTSDNGVTWKDISTITDPGYTQTIFVELLREGIRCWRPVRAEPLGDELYRIIDPMPEDEDWAFAPGDTVKCKMHRVANGDGLLAHQKVDGTKNST